MNTIILSIILVAAAFLIICVIDYILYMKSSCNYFQEILFYYRIKRNFIFLLFGEIAVYLITQSTLIYNNFLFAIIIILIISLPVMAIHYIRIFKQYSVYYRIKNEFIKELVRDSDINKIKKRIADDSGKSFNSVSQDEINKFIRIAIKKELGTYSSFTPQRVYAKELVYLYDEQIDDNTFSIT